MLKRPELFQNGFHLTHFPLGEEVRALVREERWPALDDCFHELTKKGGRLFEFLREFHDFESMEFIISVRDAANDWEEDGVWHDDGSRVFAFSLSLTDGPLEGGRLGIRRKNEEPHVLIPTPDAGGIILFLTGLYGFEHRIHQVKVGRRVIIAGWCS